ncbi:SLAP domain-containing protein [Filobacillus milosensis]|uniref:SLAP domain-containing protein n=1 Tax=Filobacillus milosensis TaxID=94137 RepID=A0A4Y8IBB1_9BACI|nr:SLAP domain-containing protein [Filobacillus milosensis]TFB13109.1 SLAP domain-containing protein [Filobacillus milosensis]
MQKLQFEKKWDKTISDQDRSKIEEVFDETQESDEEFEAVTVWHANNHKGELLVTALIHNRSDQTVLFRDTDVIYKTLDEQIAERTFDIPALQIPPKTSMPWTFIFPDFTLEDSNLGLLKITNYVKK